MSNARRASRSLLDSASRRHETGPWGIQPPHHQTGDADTESGAPTSPPPRTTAATRTPIPHVHLTKRCPYQLGLSRARYTARVERITLGREGTATVRLRTGAESDYATVEHGRDLSLVRVVVAAFPTPDALDKVVTQGHRSPEAHRRGRWLQARYAGAVALPLAPGAGYMPRVRRPQSTQGHRHSRAPGACPTSTRQGYRGSAPCASILHPPSASRPRHWRRHSLREIAAHRRVDLRPHESALVFGAYLTRATRPSRVHACASALATVGGSSEPPSPGLGPSRPCWKRPVLRRA